MPADERWVSGVAGTDITELEGVTFAFRPYAVPREHDHCESCMAGFSEDFEHDLHEGWTSTDAGARVWLCDPCFQRFRGTLGLRVAADVE